MIRVVRPQFLISATAPPGYPPDDLPEVAFVGRSNVGKSSMINALCGQRKLARISNTPGRTRTLNFFAMELERDGELKRLRLADLPGYGFAKVSKSEREAWKNMIATYIKERKSLRVVVGIIDAEVGPTSDDLQNLDYLAEHARRILVAATKIDRVAKARQKPRLKELAARLELPLEAVHPFSAKSKLGVEEVLEVLWDAL